MPNLNADKGEFLASLNGLKSPCLVNKYLGKLRIKIHLISFFCHDPYPYLYPHPYLRLCLCLAYYS